MNLPQLKHPVVEFGLGYSDHSFLIVKNKVLYIQL